MASILLAAQHAAITCNNFLSSTSGSKTATGSVMEIVNRFTVGHNPATVRDYLWVPCYKKTPSTIEVYRFLAEMVSE